MEEKALVEPGRRQFLKSSLALGAISAIDGHAMASPVVSSGNDREYWVGILTKVSHPVLKSLSEGKLKAEMPVEAPHGNAAERRQFTYLEAMGRLLAGIAPWLESGPQGGAEGALRGQYAEWARAAIRAGTDPASPDFMNFTHGRQPVVDAGFLSLAILRAPTELWRKLDPAAQRHLVGALQSTRIIRPPYNNWLMFSATIEAALSLMACRGTRCAWIMPCAASISGTRVTEFTATGRSFIGIITIAL